MLGLEKSRFLSDIPDEFFCSICLNVFSYKNSVEDDKGHAFCYSCIRAWLAERKTCPLDNCALDEKKLRPMGLAFRSLIGRLEVKCKYNMIGCAKICQMDMLESHEINCTFQDLICRNCNLTIPYDDLSNHKCLLSLINVTTQLKNENKNIKNENLTLKSKLILLEAKEHQTNALQNISTNIPRNQETNNVVKSETNKQTAELNEKILYSIASIKKKTLNYEVDLNAAYSKCEFAINNAGFIFLLCFNDQQRGTCNMLLYDQNLALVKKVTVIFIGTSYRCAITDDKIYIAYVNRRKATVDSFNFNFQKLCTFERIVHNLESIFSIDIINNKIYFKATSHLRACYTYRVFVLNRELTESYTFKMKTPTNFSDMFIKNDEIISLNKNEENCKIDIKSLTHLKTKRAFTIDLVYLSVVIGHNDNLFLFDQEHRAIREYSLNGDLVRMGIANGLDDINEDSGVQINDAFKFVISAPAVRKLYLSN